MDLGGTGGERALVREVEVAGEQPEVGDAGPLLAALLQREQEEPVRAVGAELQRAERTSAGARSSTARISSIGRLTARRPQIRRAWSSCCRAYCR
jgi:hypothetical protein